MNEIKKLAAINIIVLLIYTVIIVLKVRSTYSHTYEVAINTSLYMAIAIFVHISINLVLSAKFFSKDEEKKKWGKAYLLNCLIVLLAGVAVSLISLSF